MLNYVVSTFRESGLEAKWGRTRYGAPIIFARKPNTKTWWAMDKGAWATINQASSVAEGFENASLLGDIFSIPA